MQERHKKILELLAVKENLSVNELSESLKVTGATIRSDLTHLAKADKVERLHGRARIKEGRTKQEYTFHVRRSLNSVKKEKIGAVAANMVSSLDSILLDASSTVLALAHALKFKDELEEITVIPTGIWTAIELMGCENVNVLLPGGYLRHVSGSITGLPTSDFFNDIIIQKAFLGAWGISAENGVTDTNLLEIELKKHIVKRAKEVILLVDGSKFNQVGLSSFAEINQLSKVITDSSAPKNQIENLKKAGVEVMVLD
jgi:DeoR/GlpR family transcriptional regulator of sugar metabolism